MDDVSTSNTMGRCSMPLLGLSEGFHRFYISCSRHEYAGMSVDIDNQIQ
jgi:hypothetical protein